LQAVDYTDVYKEANKIANAGDYSQPTAFSGGFVMFKLNDRQPARIKTFEEAKAEVSGEYQEMISKKLENDYLVNLEKRYEPKL
ncbi:MAG: peptidyl-prolyl cis-trans isomerase, partial [Ignavibacteriaceae bacterium]|nr:peptidyl-prolyl cis-trans isomerase [Ignavibacteriaceae bacterium]